MPPTDPLPQFAAPPLVETVLGVQFARVDLTNALAGWYWKSVLGEDWPRAREAPRLDEAFERFGDKRIWQTLPQALKFLPGDTPSRLQIFRADQQRLVQVQDTRFVYNWQRVEASPVPTYPTYATLLPEFVDRLDAFSQFVARAGLGVLSLNQWEVVYVNMLPRGESWQILEDLHRVFPRLQVLVPSLPADGFAGNWVSTFSNRNGLKAGRLYVELKRARTPQSVDVIRLQLIARGPIDDANSLADGLDLGHETIVRAFTDMTSTEAHQRWQRTR